MAVNQEINLRRLYWVGPATVGAAVMAVMLVSCAPNLLVALSRDAGGSGPRDRDVDLTIRMSIRRFTRLTNAFSKKVENHAAMVSLFFMYYDFARVHQTVRVTPAMEAGIADHVWEP